MRVEEEEKHSTAASFHRAAVTRLTSRLVCLFVCLPAARGTRGPSSSRAAASSSPPHTSSGGPLRCHFAVGWGGGGGSRQTGNNHCGFKRGKTRVRQKHGSRGGREGEILLVWAVRCLCVSGSGDGMIETGINLKRTRDAVM